MALNKQVWKSNARVWCVCVCVRVCVVSMSWDGCGIERPQNTESLGGPIGDMPPDKASSAGVDLQESVCRCPKCRGVTN